METVVDGRMRGGDGGGGENEGWRRWWKGVVDGGDGRMRGGDGGGGENEGWRRWWRGE